MPRPQWQYNTIRDGSHLRTNAHAERAIVGTYSERVCKSATNRRVDDRKEDGSRDCSGLALFLFILDSFLPCPFLFPASRLYPDSEESTVRIKGRTV